MYDTESSACGLAHFRVINEWLQPEEPITNWFAAPSRLAEDFVRHPKREGRLKRRFPKDKIKVTTIDLPSGAIGVARSTALEQSLENQFSRLVAEWREATENISSLTQILSHPAYQRIIDLGKRGEPVLPLILEDLDKRRGYWATALQTISGENPVDSKHIGNPTKVREDWLRWGKRRGYI
jgi:hypothetical protein